ncbi:transcription termination factor MTERF8, chloroplastic-like [Apium graveolens]|uniref:transcription termination factor MTERF8, chloroplastic-like n=1 Tax=Apium graveolens TaxID=4045 RepID=UPI003D7B49E7
MVALLRWFTKLKSHPILNIYTSTYATISNKPCDLSKKTSSLNTNSFMNLLQTYGFSETHINKILVKQHVCLLGPKTLKPKLDFLLSICNQSQSDVVKIVHKTPHLLRRSLKNHLVPIFDMLKSVTGSHRSAAAAVMRNPFVLTYCCSRDLLQNIELLQKVGVPEDQILKFVTGYGQVTGKQHVKFSEVVMKVRDMGFDLSSYNFRRAVICLCLINDENWEAKCQIYRSFGFSDDEIVSMFRKLPAVVAFSEKRIGKVLEFYVKKLGWTPSRLEVMPYVMAFSLEKRIIPRCLVLQALESRKSISSSSGFYQILGMTDIAFLERYVTAYMDEVPEVMDAYTGKLTFGEYTFRCKD